MFFFNCNYDINDYSFSSQFYTELLQWWSEFRDNFATTKDWVNIIWNNKDIRINDGPVFYKNYFESGVVFVHDLLLHLNNTDSFKIIENKIYKTNLLIWTGLRHSVPKYLKESNVQLIPLCSFNIEDSAFDVTKKKSKHSYSLLLNKKAQLPNMARKLQNDFNFTSEQLQQMFNLPHQVALEPYMKGFQYKVLNFIFYTNSKLHKIGYSTDDK